MNEKDGLWRDVIVSIHNLYNKPTSYIARKSWSGVCSNISMAFRSIELFQLDWKDIFALIPGSEVKIILWRDPWCNNTPFQTKFPHLYALETVKNYLLGGRLSINGFSWMWRSEPTGPEELNELWKLYMDIENMNIKKKIQIWIQVQS